MSNKNSEPSFTEVQLKKFKKNNPHCNISIKDDLLILEKPWGREDVILQEKTNNQTFINDLNNVKFNPKFDAICHLDKNKVEFIFAYLNPEHEIDKSFLNRKYEINYQGKAIQCYFKKPTKRLFRIAKSSEHIPSEEQIKSVPQLRQFRDIQDIQNKPEYIKKFFKGKEPRSFFIEHKDIFSLCLTDLAKHINFISRYYDRFAPEILIKEEEIIRDNPTKPKRFLENKFPESLVISPLDEVVLKLIEVARSSQARSAYLYYYQVFEYTGDNYIDEQVKISLKKALKDPTFINFDDEKIAELFHLLTDLNHQYDVKMRKVIESNCNPDKLWEEIENDKDFFANDIEFDGGLVIKALISKDLTKDGWKKMWMPKLFDTFTKIRNALVHARERREKKVIMPTKNNNIKLTRFLPLIARTAEEIALKTN